MGERTFRRSCTPTSAIAAPRRPSGARFTQAETRRPINVVTTLWATIYGLRLSRHTAIRTTIDGDFPPRRIFILDQPLTEVTKVLAVLGETRATHEAAMKSSKQFTFR